jgi:hypothetical protein
MPSLWEEMESDGPEFLETFGRPIVFRGQTISALIGRSAEMQSLTDGGFIYSGSFNVRIFAPTGTPFANELPEQGERMVIWGKEYTITGITARPPAPWIDLLVVNTNTV